MFWPPSAISKSNRETIYAPAHGETSKKATIFKRLYNEVEAYVSHNNFDSKSSIFFSKRVLIADTLKKIFSEEQLTLIEIAFEGPAMTRHLPEVDEQLSDRAAQLYLSSLATGRSSRERLRSIIENALAHNGIFTP